ncbi:MAG: hypothetical protein U0X20_31985 [Caldilineaceae bacterium]
MDVSINYPWGTHASRSPQTGEMSYAASPGWDFGGPPAGWGVQLPNGRYGPYWKRYLLEDLRLFHRIGIKAVRFALLFNGLMYGVNGDIPRQGPNRAEPWLFRPVPLSQQFLTDFRELVQTFQRFNTQHRARIRLMPVVFGFEFVDDPYRENRQQRENCRSRLERGEFCKMPKEFVYDPEQPARNGFADFYAPATLPGRTRYSAGRRGMALSRSHSEAGERGTRLTYGELFLREVLVRLLQEFQSEGALAHCHDVIHSWDLCGEPEGFTAGPNSVPVWPHVVNNTDMLAYLTEGIGTVHNHGFEVTVGFRYVDTAARWQWPLPNHLQQFHTYDGERLPRVLPNASTVIGEAATTERISNGSRFDPRFRYPADAEAPPTVIPLQDRLEWFESRGYREVFLWSAGRAAPDERHSWTRYEQDQIERFTGGLHPARALRLSRFLPVP